MAAPAAAAASSSSSAAEQAQFLLGAPASSLSARAQALLADTRALFGSTFGVVADNELSIGVAPGRVNLIGEHTDYNDGFVMPLAIDRHTVVLGRRNGLQVFRIISANANEKRKAGKRMPMEEEDGEDEEEGEEGDVAMDSAAAEEPEAAEESPVAPPALIELDLATMVAKYAGPIWHNYFRGVVAQFIAAGHAVPYFDVAIGGNVPLGGGLSSSASLEVATAVFLQALLQLPLDGVTRALWCQKCEHEFCNCPCGVMDQFVASLAKKDHVMLLDCRSLQPTMVPFNDPKIALLITNSNVPHGLGDGQYEIRVKQCAEAVGVLQLKWPNIRKLRDASVEQLSAVAQMMDEEVFARARHVIMENDRTQKSAELLSRGDYASLGQLMTFSHVSMKNDYEISCDEVDCLVDIALELPGVHGSRMTGGGFGGCTISLVEAEHIDKVEEAIQAEYKERTGIDATTIVTRPGPGACIIKL